MKQIAPDYYKEFSCIADKCRHSCCIGWEIDIDEETMQKYRARGGEFGARLMQGICEDADGAHFILDKDARCPFLNSCGLCDIYLEMGESALSQICTDHPRFRSFFSDRVEIGIGLCCEAAAELVLNRKEKMQLIVLDDNGKRERLSPEEKGILAMREEMIAAAQDESISLEERFEEVLSLVDMELEERSFCEWAAIYLELERLEDSWGELLAKAAKACEGKDVESDTAHDHMFTNLLVYFLYRNVGNCESIEDVELYAALSVHATDFVRKLCTAVGANTKEKIADVVRAYSSEIEYSQENMDVLLELV